MIESLLSDMIAVSLCDFLWRIEMVKGRLLSAALALIGSAVTLIIAASKTKEEIINEENKKKNRRYRIKK